MLNKQQQHHLDGSALDQVLLQGLKDSLATEHTLITLLPRYAKASVSLELTSTFDLYAAQTEDNISKLRQAFKLLGQNPAQGSTRIYRIINKVLKSSIIVEAGYSVSDPDLVMLAQDMVRYQIDEHSKLQKNALTNGCTQISDLLADKTSQLAERQLSLIKLQAEIQCIIWNDNAIQITE
jgi:ferritin-like metal-binding protein YciE